MPRRRSTQARLAPAKVAPLVVQEMDTLITRLLKDDVSLEEVFALSLRAEDYLRVFKERAIVHATKHIPKVIESMASAAVQGDVVAAKWLADIVGLVPVSRTGGQGPTVLTQITVSTPKVRDVIDVGDEPGGSD